MCAVKSIAVKSHKLYLSFVHGAFQRNYYMYVNVHLQVNVELQDAQAVTETRHVSRMRDYSRVPFPPAAMRYAPAGGVYIHVHVQVHDPVVHDVTSSTDAAAARPVVVTCYDKLIK